MRADNSKASRAPRDLPHEIAVLIVNEHDRRLVLRAEALETLNEAHPRDERRRLGRSRGRELRFVVDDAEYSEVELSYGRGLMS